VAYVHRREGKRGRATRYTMYWVGEDGRKKSRAGVTDKAESQRIANRLEEEARLVREGLLDPAERVRREASLRSVADHLADYRRDMAAKGDTAKHVDRTVRAIGRLLAEAGVAGVAAIPRRWSARPSPGSGSQGRGRRRPTSARPRPGRRTSTWPP
jgi:hypothetical protein